jgi:hypothetical protein
MQTEGEAATSAVAGGNNNIISAAGDLEEWSSLTLEYVLELVACTKGVKKLLQWATS